MTLTGEIEETLAEATEAMTAAKATEVAISPPEARPPTGSGTLLHPTTSALKTTKADTKRLIGAFHFASSVGPKRPFRTVTSNNSFALPLPRSVALALQR